MTGADLQWSDIEVNVAGGLNEGVDERLLPPGQLAAVLNCEFSSKDSSVRKRPGSVNVSGPPNGLLEISPGLNRLLVHDTKNQLLAVDLSGVAAQSPALYAPLDAMADGDQVIDQRRVGFAPNALTRRYPLATDLTSEIRCDGTYVNTTTNFGYMVYGMVSKQTGRLTVKIVQVPKIGAAWEPANTVEDVNIAYDAAIAPSVAFWVRAAAANDRYVLITWEFYRPGGGAANEIWGLVVDCGTSPQPTIGTLTQIVAVGDTGFFYHDTAESTSTADVGGDPNWMIVYRSAGQINVERILANLTIDWTQNFAAFFEPQAVSVFEKAGITWVNWFDADTMGAPADPGWFVATVVTTTGAVGIAPTRWCSGADIGATQLAGLPLSSGIAFINNTNVELFHSQAYTDGLAASWGGITPPTGVAETPITRWRSVTNVAALGGLTEKRNLALYSKPWKDDITGWFDAWCGVTVARDTAALSDVDVAPDTVLYEYTGVLMRFCDQDATEGGLCSAYPIGSTAQNSLQWAGGSNSADPGFVGVPSSITYGAYPHSTTANSVAIGRRTSLGIRYVPLEAMSGPWDVVFRTEENQSFSQGFTRYQSERLGQSVYASGGVLTQWDGDRHHENNFMTAPTLSVQRTDSGVGGAGVWPAAWAGQKLYVMAVWETVGEGGERTRSGTSNLVTVTFENPAPPAARDVFRFFVEPNTVGMRNFGGSNQEYQHPRTICTLYISETLNSPTLHRLYTFQDTNWNALTSDPDGLVPLTFDLTTNTQLPLETNEVIYTDSGELDNDPVIGGCSTIAVHKERLWVAGGDDPEVVWYSKERVDGRSAEFSGYQQIRVPGAEVTALASLDDALIVFCRHATYAVYGDGPNATGDPASGIFTVVPRSTSIGCNCASSVATFPGGILFRSEAGLAIMDRAGAISYVGATADSAVGTFAPSYAFVDPENQQVRLGYNDGATSDALVMDWTNNLWAKWRFAYTQGNVVHMKRLGRYTYIITADGSIHREDSAKFADAGAAFRQQLQLGVLSFGRTLGYKRIGHMGILTQPNSWSDESGDPNNFEGGLSATVKLNYAQSGSEITREWSAYELGQIAAQDGITLLRLHIGKQQPAVQVTLNDVAPGLYLSSTNADPINTLVNERLRIKIQASAGWTVWTFTANAALSKATLLSEMNTKIAAAGWTDYLKASVSGGVLTLETIKRESSTGLGSYLAVDTVANGSTLNTPLGLSAGGAVGAAIVSEADQAGFVFQTLSFEVGQAPGIARRAKAQSR